MAQVRRRYVEQDLSPTSKWRHQVGLEDGLSPEHISAGRPTARYVPLRSSHPAHPLASRVGLHARSPGGSRHQMQRESLLSECLVPSRKQRRTERDTRRQSQPQSEGQSHHHHLRTGPRPATPCAVLTIETVILISGDLRPRRIRNISFLPQRRHTSDDNAQDRPDRGLISATGRRV